MPAPATTAVLIAAVRTTPTAATTSAVTATVTAAPTAHLRRRRR